MLTELNSTGVSSLKAVRKIADSIEIAAGWAKDELKDAASMSKEVNVETRSIRKSIAIESYNLELQKEQYKTAKSKAKFEAKIASSDIKINITAGE